jgi:hypothetical protein
MGGVKMEINGCEGKKIRKKTKKMTVILRDNDKERKGRLGYEFKGD